MITDQRALFDASLVDSAALHERARPNPQLVLDAAATIVDAFRRGRTLLLFGNGGSSANVLAALEAATAKGLKTVALTGKDGGAVGRAAAIHLNVPAASIARVQEVHRTLLHIICDIVERELIDSSVGLA